MSRSKNTHIREVWQDRLFHIFNQILFVIILFIVIYPLYFISDRLVFGSVGGT